MKDINIGRRSELIVAADLIKRGYDVYMGYYSQYDMVAILNGGRYTVEVKTSRSMKWDWHRFKYKADIYALVSHEGVISYQKCYKEFT